jgi:hypothetical protein
MATKEQILLNANLLYFFNKFEKFEVRWQKLKKKRVNRQNYLRSTNVVLLLTTV